jgi:hypothetical protein
MMEEVGGGIPIYGGDDELKMQTCSWDDWEATREGAPLASHGQWGQIVKYVDVNLVNARARVGTRDVDRRWVAQSQLVVEQTTMDTPVAVGSYMQLPECT